MKDEQSLMLLHDQIKRWIEEMGWEGLREIQEEALSPILEARTDLIISAETASGKTEAAFLPALSKAKEAKEDGQKGIQILYISPLKALINDQLRRLDSLSRMLGLKLTSWHGDAKTSPKKKLQQNPDGVLLITPESLEAMLLLRDKWLRFACPTLSYVIIDEFHVFLDSERGMQLRSLLHRLEVLLQKKVPRIALSATLPEPEQAFPLLRSEEGVFERKVIYSKSQKSSLDLELRSYSKDLSTNGGGFELSVDSPLSRELYGLLRGGSHLVFCNSRKQTESLAAALRELSERAAVPNEFFPHHGSLSAALRSHLEERLQSGSFPTTAICTSTLELGIDIGHVDSVAQISSPFSVASLRQRVGRSGRRGENPRLRIFLEEEPALGDDMALLRLPNFQSMAMLNLLKKGWCEPPAPQRHHYSTLVQQSLSAIAQYGAIHAVQLFTLLCQDGPFQWVSAKDYASLLQHLGKKDMISQTEDGALCLGHRGEGLVSHFRFYAAFSSEKEYQVVAEGKIIGTYPVSHPARLQSLEGDCMIFAGKTWKILLVDIDKRRLVLARSQSGQALNFPGHALSIHSEIRKEMQRIYEEKDMPSYLNDHAKRMFQSGTDTYRRLGLHESSMCIDSNDIILFSFTGDKLCHSIVGLLNASGLKSKATSPPIIKLESTTLGMLKHALEKLLHAPPINPESILGKANDESPEKHDHLVPKELSLKARIQNELDLEAAYAWLGTFYEREFGSPSGRGPRRIGPPHLRLVP